MHAVSPDDTLQRVLEIMADVQVHRVPVVDDSRTVVGISSITDVARWVQSSPKRSDELRAAALSAVVAISAPATAIAPARSNSERAVTAART